MSDDRFDRDLTEVLREIAGEEAPMSLRNRLSDIADRAPIGHRFWFATPMRLSMVAAAAVAVLALGILFWPRQDVGPSPSDSPGPSASVAPSPSGEPSPSPSGEPTPVPTVAPTPVPTPTPVARWTGLTWSDPVTPPFTIHLTDLVPWGDGYVAGGVASVVEDAGGVAALLTSVDGLHWTVAEQISSGYPGFLTVLDLTILDDELYAFSHPTADALPDQPLIWRSTDGATWTPVDSPSWEGAWHLAVPQIGSSYPDGWDQAQHDLPLGVADVASGPDGLVAIGNSFGEDTMAPIIVHSTDGETWTTAELPAGSDSALLNAVAEHDGRFVITGATGVWADPATAVAAAWYSDDGVTWVRATVEPNEFDLQARADFGPLWAGDDGLLACSGSRYMTAGGWRYMTEWLSTDGASWRAAPDQDQSHACDWSASDGTRIVSLGPRDVPPPPWPGVTVAWASTDGEHWQSMELQPTLTDRLERFWVVPDGVIYAGEQSFWFGTAATEP
jgi:hypothetical protein